jgi:hypothetical protein
MIETVHVSAATCDGCGKRRLGDNDFEDVPGFMGTIVQILDDGTGGERGSADWYACRQRCIGKAAFTAVSRADNEQRTHGNPA